MMHAIGKSIGSHKYGGFGKNEKSKLCFLGGGSGVTFQKYANIFKNMEFFSKPFMGGSGLNFNAAKCHNYYTITTSVFSCLRIIDVIWQS